MKNNMLNTIKSLMANTKNAKIVSHISASTINMSSDQKRIPLVKKEGATVNQSNHFDYATEVAKKPEPSSYRSSKDPKLPCHSKKNSEVPLKKDLVTIMLKRSAVKIQQEEKKCQSLKKHQHNKHSSIGKLMRANRLLFHQENNINNSHYCNNNTSGIIHINQSNIGGGTNETGNVQGVNEMKQTIMILMSYINTMNYQLDETISQRIKIKDEEISKLKAENECLIKANTQLKLKLLEVLYTAKVYDLNELNRKSSSEALMSQLYKENSYLRNANIETVRTDFIYADNCSPGISENEKANLMKPKHKRQKTHINLNSIKVDKENNVEVLLLSSTTKKNVNSYENEDSNALSLVISDLGNMIKTLKKRSDSSKKVLPYNNELNASKDSKSSGTSSSPSNANVNNPIQPLYYNRATGNKERKMIEFTK